MEASNEAAARRRRSRWRGPAILLALVFLVLLVDMLRSGPLWRSAYPLLPRQVQGIPYRLRARFQGPAVTPVPIPTSSLVEGSGFDLESLGDEMRVTPTAPKDDAPAETRLSPTIVGVPAEGESEADELASSPTNDRPVSTPPSPVPALPPSARLSGLQHEYQTWNNCGPATISMALNLVGDEIDQAKAARSLKPDPDDKNVSPEEMSRLAADRGFGSALRSAGDIEMLQRLLALGLPVVVETWFVPDPGDEMGHYRLLTGYRASEDENEAGIIFRAADSYLGPSIEIPAETLDQDWRAFNRSFLVVYPPERETEVAAVLDPVWLERDALDRMASVAMDEIAAREDVWAWYNLGAGLMGLGDVTAASHAFDRARAIGLPWRLLWYRFEIFEAYAAAGRWEDVLALANANLQNAPNLEESHYWRGRALAATGDLESAEQAFREAQRLNPNFALAARALSEIVQDP